MAHYYIHLRDGNDVLLDPDGREFASAEDLRAAAVVTAWDVMVGDVATGVLDLRLRLEAEDAEGHIALVMPFSDVVEIRHPTHDDPITHLLQDEHRTA